MPHITIEYSANLAGELDRDGLIKSIHNTAVATGVFPLGGTRTRAVRRDEYRVADGHPDNAFIHFSLRIGHGRDLETRKLAGEALIAAAKDFLAPIFARRPLAISLDIQEIDPILTYKHNNIHEYVAARHKSGRAA